MNEKHAYLILAHNDPKVLELLVRLLDDSRIIFMLIKKVI